MLPFQLPVVINIIGLHLALTYDQKPEQLLLLIYSAQCEISLQIFRSQKILSNEGKLSFEKKSCPIF